MGEDSRTGELHFMLHSMNENFSIKEIDNWEKMPFFSHTKELKN